MKTTTTSRVALIGLAVATIAILPAALSAVTTLTSISLVQQAEAARSGPQHEQWQHCYNTFSVAIGYRCFPNNGECQQAQSEDIGASSGCYRYRGPF
jgi:hypothetical protein